MSNQESFELLDKKELDKRFPNRTSLLVIVSADISLAHNQYDSRASIERSRPRDAVFIKSRHLPFVFEIDQQTLEKHFSRQSLDSQLAHLCELRRIRIT